MIKFTNNILLILMLLFSVLNQEFVLASTIQNQQDDQVSVDISLYDIKIDALFHGQKISLYGAVDNYPVDIIISFTGPDRDMVVLEKIRKFYFWVDGDNIKLKNVPSFFALLSNRDIKLITASNVLQQLNLKIDEWIVKAEDSLNKNYTAEDYRRIFLTVGKERNIVQQHYQGVNFLAGNMLFRADLYLPSYIVSGDYDVNVYIFKYGRLIGQKTLTFHVVKSDIQYFINNLAKNYSMIYAILAVLLIWFVSLVLHRAIRRIF